MSRYERKTSRDMVRSRERPVADERRRTEKQQHVEFLIAGNKKQFIFKTWRNNKLQQEKVFAPTCVLMAPASRSSKYGRCGELHPLM